MCRRCQATMLRRLQVLWCSFKRRCVTCSWFATRFGMVFQLSQVTQRPPHHWAHLSSKDLAQPASNYQGISIQFKPWGPRNFAGPAMQVIALTHSFREHAKVNAATTDPVLYIWFAFASCVGISRGALARLWLYDTLQCQVVIPAVGLCSWPWEWHSMAPPNRCQGQITASVRCSWRRVRWHVTS